MSTCPECKGTGEYVGLNVREPCRTCGGKAVDMPTLESAKAVQLSDTSWGVIADYKYVASSYHAGFN